MYIKKIILPIYLLFCSLCVAKGYAADKYAVLAYHSVVDESRPVDKSLYVPQTISSAMLIRQFNWLQENGYRVISWQQVLDAEQGKTELPEKAVLLSFDDGYETMYSVIYPLLKAYNYPAVFAPVTRWVDTAEKGQVQYGAKKLDRSAFTTWRKIREMYDSGLVEIASHTYDSHHGVAANPAGSQLPALIAPIYRNGKYETEAQYQKRITQDLKTSAHMIKQRTGITPRLIVWPYGQFNQAAINAAKQAGLTHHFSLNAEKTNTPGDPHVGRLLLDAETDFSTIAAYLNQQADESQKIQRVIHVDLDYVYDKNPLQQKKNLDALIQRIYDYGVTTVYLQAYADDDGNGVADALYFPNKYLPVKADLFGQVAWQLMKRTEVKVYAWMPTLAFDLSASAKKAKYVTDKRTGKPAADQYLRLSPYDKENIEMLKSIYRDLSFYTKFNGILFHDDAFLTDFEAPASIAEKTMPPGEEKLVSREAKQKNRDLIKLTLSLKKALEPYFLYGGEALKTSRNIYAALINEPQSEEWFAQNLAEFVAHYDSTAIMAMPYLENEAPLSRDAAYGWLQQLIEKINSSALPKDKILFELQSYNWRSGKPIPESELIRWMQLLEQNQLMNFGYYPDDFLLNRPDITRVKPYLSVKQGEK
ncbi:biofilm PGA synthesis lipoprotein PgaB [Mesocricetibacter intestinalis]|uniref:Biofilm PGA synthesis lipoprotein PgaB n=1 Tax=Mesocricetibacter intestinalis TaxID=1521930 RepID=A0A4R6VBN4_9PAST|nr:poly-beta-1,6-N-acetyl-D-glucosamine N-deacetylase PgaB [Mesocricetibacter intestinalis]TDQ57350.1 biofilm PGA synthesis lipoprotein PgaB [Mesocricetibacter intestinalis]